MITPLAGISYGVVTNHVTIKNLTTVVEDTSDRVGLAINDMQKSLSSLACMYGHGPPPGSRFSFG
jgi:hypothetical protein